MPESEELEDVRRRWAKIQPSEELLVYKILLEELQDLPGDFYQRYEEGRVLPKLAVAAFQLREHSKALVRWTMALVVLTSVLSFLTLALILVQLMK